MLFPPPPSSSTMPRLPAASHNQQPFNVKAGDVEDKAGDNAVDKYKAKDEDMAGDVEDGGRSPGSHTLTGAPAGVGEYI
jgi:hypothetical protein